MGLDSILRKGVAIANKVTASLQIREVSHTAWVADDGANMPTYALPLTYSVIVERGNKAVRTKAGTDVVPTYLLSFLVPVPSNGATGRDEPVDTRDLLTLPDGTVAPVLGCVDGVLDPATNAPYALVVAVGSGLARV